MVIKFVIIVLSVNVYCFSQHVENALLYGSTYTALSNLNDIVIHYYYYY